MGTSHLITMANDIAAFFVAESDADAANKVAEHLKRYWDPRMRRQIVEYLSQGGDGLVPAARAAVDLLAADAGRIPADVK